MLLVSAAVAAAIGSNDRQIISNGVVVAAINVSLNGIDNISPVLTGIVAKGTAMGNVLTGALSAVGQGLGAIAGGVREQFTEASRVQLQMIGSSGSLMAVLGVGYGEALNLSKELNQEFTRMAAILPGVTAEYAQIGMSVADDVFNAIRDSDGKVDLPQAKKLLLELTEGWGLLAQQAGSSADEASQNLVRMLGGDVKTLKMAMFDRSPAFKNSLDKVMAADGKTKKDWEEATTKQRALWIKDTLDMTLPPEAIEQMKVTADGVLQGWKSAIFDAGSGVFGFLREIESRDNGTVMAVLSEALMSANKMFEAIAAVFPFKVDLLAPLYDSLKFIGGMLDKAAIKISDGFTIEGVIGAASKLSDSIVGTIDRTIKSASSGLAAMLSGTSDADMGSLVDLSVGLAGVVSSLAASLRVRVLGMITSLFNGVVGAVGSLNVGSVGNLGSELGRMLGASFGLMLGVVRNLDLSGLAGAMGTVGAALISSVMGLINSVLQQVRGMSIGTSLFGGFSIGAKIGEFIGSLVINFVNLLPALISNIDAGTILGAILGIGTILTGLVTGIVFGVGQGAMTALPTLVSSMMSIITGWFSGILNTLLSVVSAFAGLESTITPVLSELVSGVAGGLSRMVSNIVSAVSGLWSSMAPLFASARTGAVSAVRAGIDGIVSAISSMMQAVSSALSSAVSGISSRISGMMPSMPSMPSIPSVGSLIPGRAAAPSTPVAAAPTPGNSNVATASNPSASSEAAALMTQHSAQGNLLPLFEAIRREKASMPSGSNLTIANTSEAILNRRQLSTLSDAMSQGRSANNSGGGNRVAPQVTINISGTSDPERVAYLVIQKLSSLTVL